MAISPYPIDPKLTGLAIAYMNDPGDYIADLIAPYTPVEGVTFEYDEFALEDMFSIPDTEIGRLSRPNQVTFSATRKPGSVGAEALESPVPYADKRNADQGYDPEAHATEGIMELLKLKREFRMANLTFSAANYPTGYKQTLSGTSQFSDATSNPYATMSTAMDSMLVRPNTLVMGQEVWTKLRINPTLVKQSRGNGTTEGVLSREEVATLLEVDQILVGRSRRNTAAEGQTLSLARLWGKHLAMLYVDPQFKLKGNVVTPPKFCTARFGTPVSTKIEDPHMGLYGGVHIKAGQEARELVISNFSGYLFTDAVA